MYFFIIAKHLQLALLQRVATSLECEIDMFQHPSTVQHRATGERRQRFGPRKGSFTTFSVAVAACVLIALLKSWFGRWPRQPAHPEGIHDADLAWSVESSPLRPRLTLK